MLSPGKPLPRIWIKHEHRRENLVRPNIHLYFPGPSPDDDVADVLALSSRPIQLVCYGIVIDVDEPVLEIAVGQGEPLALLVHDYHRRGFLV